MSVNNILIDGKINSAFLPAGVVPADPNFDSITVTNTDPAPSITLINSGIGGTSFIDRAVNGTLSISQVPPVGDGADVISVNGLANEMTVGNVFNLYLQSEGSISATSPVINLGDPDEADPTVQVVGTGATGRVFDDQFNQPYAQPTDLLGGEQIITGNTQITGNSITPNRSAMAFLSLQFSCAPGITTIGNAGVEYYLDGPGTTVAQNSWNTVLPSALAVPVGSPPIYNFGYSHTVYLQKDVVYNLVIKPYGTGWDGLVVEANLSMLNAV